MAVGRVRDARERQTARGTSAAAASAAAPVAATASVAAPFIAICTRSLNGLERFRPGPIPL
jgi:hypothetical protein